MDHSWEAYNYAGQNPVMFTDPTGLSKCKNRGPDGECEDVIVIIGKALDAVGQFIGNDYNPAVPSPSGSTCPFPGACGPQPPKKKKKKKKKKEKEPSGLCNPFRLSKTQNALYECERAARKIRRGYITGIWQTGGQTGGHYDWPAGCGMERLNYLSESNRCDDNRYPGIPPIAPLPWRP